MRDVTGTLRPGRTIEGISAVLVPYRGDGGVDWPALEAHIARTAEAGLTPAVNMDTGYVQILAGAERDRVLDVAATITSGAFVAGAFVADEAGSPFELDVYVAAASRIAERGGVPVIFPSHGLNALEDGGWVDAMRAIGDRLDRFIGFELGPMFVPYGRIVSLEAYEGLLEVGSCTGAKHSSLSRTAEWERLALRDRRRPDFRVYTGNDLAIDMVMYGSDYLLGLSTFAPDRFGERDRMWARGDPAFHELNDALQALGSFAFREPVPAYRHDAAMFLQLRGWAASDATPPGVPRRPPSDREVLAALGARLGVL